MLSKETYFIIRSENGKFIQLEQASGGYPYEVEASRAHFWKEKSEAINYMNTMWSPHNAYRANNWELKGVTVIVE